MPEFFKTTLIGGALFLLPLIVTLFLVGKAFKFMARVLTPLAAALPVPGVAGFLVADLLAILALVLVCFAAGLIARTGVGRWLGGSAENLILKKIPGFTLLKSMTRGEENLGTDGEVGVVLFETEGGHALGFAVETHASGTVTVFVPSAPTPTAGAILYLPEDKVKRLDIPVKSAVKCIMQLGVGSKDLLDRAPIPGQPS
jgi:uncharacterized membrane protein